MKPETTEPRSWSSTRLAWLVREVQRPVVIDPQRRYAEIGVRSHGRGTFQKEPVYGWELEEKKVFEIEPGDLVFNIVFAWERAVAIVRESDRGRIASHRFPVYRAIAGRADVRFLQHLFVSDLGRFLLDQNSPGAAGRNRTLDRASLLKEQVVAPAVAVQSRIADFLDRKTAVIDDLIAKKERLVAVLAEKRQALITQFVTKGLDPTAPMKRSEVGTIHRDWRVVPVRRLISGIEQGWSPEAEDRPADAGSWAVLKLGAVFQGQFRSWQQKALPFDLAPEVRYEVKPGDVLVTRANTLALVGDACWVENPPPRLMLPDLIYRLRVRHDRVHAPYLVWSLLSHAARSQIMADARGSSMSMAKVSGAHVRSWLVAMPSSQQAQIAIDGALRRAEVQHEAARARLAESIDRLREYRQALITAAVTGQLDVSDARAVATHEAVAGAGA